MTKGGEFSYPAGIEEVMNFRFRKAGSPQVGRDRLASDKKRFEVFRSTDSRRAFQGVPAKSESRLLWH